MADMGAGGKYEVQIKDEETGQTITKAIDELNEKDVANLEKMANTAPKTMEELAVSQLSVTEKMAADIKSLADQTGLGVAKTKAMGSGINLLRDTSTAVRKTLSPKEMSTKNLASSIDSGIDKSLDVLKRLTDGEISQLEARQEIGKSLSKLGSLLNSAYDTGMKNAEEESKKIKDDYPIFDQLKKLMSGDITKAESNNKQNTNITQTEISNVRNTSTIPTNTSQTTTNPSTDRPIEITLNHNIDLKTTGNVDTNQIVMALKNTDVQQGMVGALKEAIYSNGLMAPTANKTQLMNSNISASSLV